MMDWDEIKTEFETLGTSRKDLIERHSVTAERLDAAIELGEWERSVLPRGSEVGKTRSEVIYETYQENLLPTYIRLEKRFFARLTELIDVTVTPDDAKKIADTLAIIKPAIMKQDESGTNGGGLRIAIANAFPVPQPGDDNYVAPNAVIVGREAAKGTDVNHTFIEVEVSASGHMES